MTGSLNSIKGRHSMKVGIDHRRMEFNTNQLACTSGRLKLSQPKRALPLLRLDGAESRSAISVAQEFDLALLLRSKALFPQLVERLKSIAAPQPGAWANRYNLAIALLEAKLSSEAIATLGALIVERPEDANALNVRLGSTLMMKGDYNSAREAFAKAIGSHPELALGYVALAQAYLHERMEDDAVRELARARTAVPADFVVEYYYGLALARSGRQPEALAALERAIGLDQNSPEAHYELERNQSGNAAY